MAGNGKESRDLDLEEKALQAKTRSEETVTRAKRKMRPPERYGSSDPDGRISSKPKSLTHHSQADELPPPLEATDVQPNDEEEP